MSKHHDLLCEYIKTENLRKHCYAVESAMRFYARQSGEDEDRWEAAGLLHDIDWEIYPDTHPSSAVPILKENGYDDEFIEVILSHAYPERSDVPRKTKFSKYLFACDEITGFILAYSYMKPGGLDDVKPNGVLKKLKDKAFARNVNREDIRNGAEEIGIELSTHIQNIIDAMKGDLRLK
ncbi:MAG: HDIG domain-containing protein [Ignavibacteriaceae bacterium]|nr:HDIG domain-containing protein [Ignavibacteriaceae bacterium]